jgi:hypothetical protein
MSPVRCVSHAKREARAEIEPCQRAGPFDLQNEIRDSSSAVAALPRGVSSLTWTAGESRAVLFSNRWPDWDAWKQRSNHDLKREMIDKTERKKKRGNTFLKMSNFAPRAGTEEHILFVLRLGSLEHDRERCLHACSNEASCQNFNPRRPSFRALQLSILPVRGATLR